MTEQLSLFEDPQAPKVDIDQIATNIAANTQPREYPDKPPSEAAIDQGWGPKNPDLFRGDAVHISEERREFLDMLQILRDENSTRERREDLMERFLALQRKRYSK